MVPLIKSSRSLSSKAAPDRHTTTIKVDCWYDVLLTKCCYFFVLDVTGCKPSKKFNFCLLNPQNTFPKVLGINVFFVRWALVSFLVSGGFLTWVPFLLSFSYCWHMNTALYWGKWGLQLFRCCSGSYGKCMSHWYALGVILVGGHFWEGSPLFQVFSSCGWWLALWSMESQSLRNGFVTLSRLMDSNDYFSSVLEIL